jgi:16S rRNA processing protein RimM
VRARSHRPAATPDRGAEGPEKLIALGHVVKPHATRGELRLRLFNPASTALAAGSRVVLRRGSERYERSVRGVRRHGQSLLLTLEGCESMSAAEALIGYELCVRQADLPPVGSGEIYHYELVGMTVVTTTGVEIGTVSEVMRVPSNDVCVVRAGRREHLVPLIADVVKQLDRGQRRLVIDPLPGLLES